MSLDRQVQYALIKMPFVLGAFILFIHLAFSTASPLQNALNLLCLLPIRLSFLIFEEKIILLGFRYLASSIPSIVFAGVGVGVGLIFAMLLNSMARNPLISNNLVR